MSVVGPAQEAFNGGQLAKVSPPRWQSIMYANAVIANGGRPASILARGVFQQQVEVDCCERPK